MDTNQPQNVNTKSCNCAFNCSDTAVLLINFGCSFWIFFTYVLKRWLSLSTNVDSTWALCMYQIPLCSMYQMPLCSMYQMPRCVRYLYALQYVYCIRCLYALCIRFLYALYIRCLYALMYHMPLCSMLYVSDASMLLRCFYVSDAGGSNLPYY